MASRQVHVVVLSLSLMLILVLLLVTATVYKAPTASPRYPKHHLLRRTNHQQQQQQRQRAVNKVVEDRAVKKVVQEEEEEGEGEEAVGGGREQQERRLQGNSEAMATIERGKTWPHLVGLDAEEAKKKILEEHPNLQVQVVPAGGMMTMDYNLHRVRIFKNAAQKVTTAPKLG